MKIILTQDVAHLGKRSEIKEVPRGHALNFLIPRSLAIAATPENVKRREALEEKRKAEQDASKESFGKTLEALKGKTITHKAAANEKGHLFSGINAGIISSILKEAGHDVEPEDIRIEHPIKEIGASEVVLQRESQKGSFTLEIIKESQHGKH